MILIMWSSSITRTILHFNRRSPRNIRLTKTRSIKCQAPEKTEFTRKIKIIHLEKIEEVGTTETAETTEIDPTIPEDLPTATDPEIMMMTMTIRVSNLGALDTLECQEAQEIQV